MKMGKHYLRMAVQSNDTSCLRSIHLYLNQIYYLKLYGDDRTRCITSSNEKKLRHVEKEWIGYEEAKCAKQFDVMKKIYDKDTVYEALKQHDVYQHSLYDHFEKHADKNDFRWFFLNESVLNIEFFDYLVFAMIGASDSARSEIVKNVWDEAGHGNVENYHTTLYKKFLSDLKLQYNRDLIIANMPWQGLAGMNLFSNYAIYPYNKMKFYGLLAATEMLDPAHYTRLVKGVSRVFGDKLNNTYYREHAEIDILHASGWLENVILPELAVHPEKLKDFWLGFYMRLESVNQYYNYFSTAMTLSNAA